MRKVAQILAQTAAGFEKDSTRLEAGDELRVVPVRADGVPYEELAAEGGPAAELPPRR